MFKLHAIQAEFGDCFLLEFGSAAQPRFVLIDGGPPHNYQDHLKAVLTPLGAAAREIDAVILSHVDADHVAGLVEFFSELRDQRANGAPDLIQVNGLWHNSFDRAIDSQGEIVPRFQAALFAAGAQTAQMMASSTIALQGISEGNTLRVLAMQLGIPLNEGFADIISTDTAPVPVLIGPLSLQVVGPTPANLEALRKEWVKWLDKHEDAITRGEPLVMANADRSVPNLSSISVVAAVDGKTLLLTGDARSDHVLEGLASAGLTDAAGRMHVDVLKLPHHGSNRNMTKKFFRSVTADRYVVSANGKDDNPDLATLIWLVEAAHEHARNIEIIATNSTPSTDKLLEEYPEAEFGYSMTIMPQNQHSITVELGT
jgi:hypothetical protein